MCKLNVKQMFISSFAWNSIRRFSSGGIRFRTYVILTILFRDPLAFPSSRISTARNGSIRI